MIAITIDAREPIQALTAIGENLGDATDPLTDVLELGLEDARKEIQAQGALFGGGWADMSLWTLIVARTLYQKQRDPLNLLDDSGGLIGSLFRGEPGNIFRVDKTEGEAGTDYASPRTGYGIGSMMQNGTPRTFLVLQGTGYADEGGIPERPFLGWHESRLDEYAGIFAEHVWAGVDGPPEA